mmetsp:Transcript_12124/g.25587  ORF Transcript_12124/g.25587 Transcript_12124/m.25587 type:complete len:204 (-) Transcript_12124:280-891(-)
MTRAKRKADWLADRRVMEVPRHRRTNARLIDRSVRMHHCATRIHARGESRNSHSVDHHWPRILLGFLRISQSAGVAKCHATPPLGSSSGATRSAHSSKLIGRMAGRLLTFGGFRPFECAIVIRFVAPWDCPHLARLIHGHSSQSLESRHVVIGLQIWFVWVANAFLNRTLVGTRKDSRLECVHFRAAVWSSESLIAVTLGYGA